MRVVVLGGTGRTGRLICEAGRVAGHDVVCFGRSADRHTVPQGTEPHAGDVTRAEDLMAALQGCDAVITALSIPRRSPSLFSPVEGPVDLHSTSTTLLLESLRAVGAKRIIKLSAQGVGDSAPRAGWAVRAMIAVSSLAIPYADHAIADQLLRESDMEWTVLRPPQLTDGPESPVQASETLTTWSWTQLSRRSVAKFAVDCLRERATVGRCLTLAPGPSL